MTAEATNAPKKRGKVKSFFRMIGMMILGAVLVGAGFGGGFLYFARQNSPADDVLSLIDRTAPKPAEEAEPKEEHDPNMPQKVPKPVPEEASFVTSYYTFEEPLTTNLVGSRRFAQVTVGLSTQYDQKVIDNVTTHAVALRSDMLTVLGAFTEDEITGKEGKERLAVALRDACNERLLELEGFGGIEAVFFPSFVLQ